MAFSDILLVFIYAPRHDVRAHSATRFELSTSKISHLAWYQKRQACISPCMGRSVRDVSHLHTFCAHTNIHTKTRLQKAPGVTVNLQALSRDDDMLFVQDTSSAVMA